jgi:hypothetical protein
MRIPVQIIADSCLAAASALLGVALDAVLFGVFRSHLRQAVAVERYRPVYSRSGRRNRVRS